MRMETLLWFLAGALICALICVLLACVYFYFFPTDESDS